MEDNNWMAVEYRQFSKQQISRVILEWFELSDEVANELVEAIWNSSSEDS